MKKGAWRRLCSHWLFLKPALYRVSTVLLLPSLQLPVIAAFCFNGFARFRVTVNLGGPRFAARYHDSQLQHGVVLHATGYLAALLMHQLLSRKAYAELYAELEQVRDAASAEE